MTFDKDGVLGLGLKYKKQSPSGLASRDVDGNHVSHESEEKGKRSFGPFSNKTSTYLSQFILYIAAIGDIVDGTDTTHDFNFFSLVYEWPKDVSVSWLFLTLFIIYTVFLVIRTVDQWSNPVILLLFGETTEFRCACFS